MGEPYLEVLREGANYDPSMIGAIITATAISLMALSGSIYLIRKEDLIRYCIDLLYRNRNKNND